MGGRAQAGRTRPRLMYSGCPDSRGAFIFDARDSAGSRIGPRSSWRVPDRQIRPCSDGQSCPTRRMCTSHENARLTPGLRRTPGLTEDRAGRSVDRHDNELGIAAGGAHLDGFADGSANERPADRRHVRDPAGRRIGLGWPDQLVDGHVVGRLGIGDRDPRAKTDLASRVARRCFYDGRVAQERLDRLDPALQERLLLARGAVVGVLLEVAELLG